MYLKDIARKIISEDTWGNNPSAAAPQNPGRSPTPAPSGATGNVRFYDFNKSYNDFKTTIDKQEAGAKAKLDGELTKELVNKTVTVLASKGSVGQVEKEYTMKVSGVDIRRMKDKFYIVLQGGDKSEYYVDTTAKAKIDNTPQEAPTMGSSLNKPQAGGIVYPQNMGMSTKNN